MPNFIARSLLGRATTLATGDAGVIYWAGRLDHDRPPGWPGLYVSRPARHRRIAMAAPFRIGFLLFPDITQLDMTGPYEVLTKLPGAEVHLVSKTMAPVRAGGGMQIVPTTTYAECPQFDMLCVPGGSGVNPLLEDEATLSFLRRQAAAARYVTSVCTGSLVLGAAGLLKGKRAATHWMSMDMLKAFGATPVHQRVVVDGNVITGGGVTAGIDFGLTVAAEVAGADVAREIQLAIEYDPHPPFNAGSPAGAGPELTARATNAASARQAERAAAVRRAAARLG
jgi:cyclohexyl-isocyanide hydratase